MPWSAPTQMGVLVALTVAMGRSNARIGGAVGDAAPGPTAPDGWLAPPDAGCPALGVGGWVAAAGRAVGALGAAVQANRVRARPIVAQRVRRITSSLLF